MQALGANESECQPDVHDYLLEDGDQLLLCTDGLTDMVDNTEIESVLGEENSAQLISASASLASINHPAVD